MNKFFMALTVSALVLNLNTADAVWGNTRTTTPAINSEYTPVSNPYTPVTPVNNAYSNQNFNKQTFTDNARDAHQYRNSYYVQQNGGTIAQDQNNAAPNQIAPNSYSAQPQVSSSRSQFANPAQAAAGSALLIQTARLATIERDMYGNTDGFVLILKGVEPNLAFFNNNGQRMIGKVAINDFINSMQSTNGASAALVSTSTTPDNAPDLQESVIIVSHPVYDARAQTLKFNIDNLNGSQLRAGSHQNPVLLIDSTFMNQ